MGLFQRWELAPAAVIAALAALTASVAARMPGTRDVGLAYLGGVEAFRSGHPETVFTWISTPFLAMVMALATRLASAEQLANAYNLFNIGLAVALIAITWARLRGRVDARTWWMTLLAAVIFAPLISTLWWKQFSLLALALAAGGFALLRDRAGRFDLAASVLIGLSISVKPIVILLPFALLLRRDSRRVGLYSLAWLAFLQAAAQAFLAWRAGDPGTLSPLPALANFATKSLPQTNGWACNIQNLSPTAMLCRVLGGPEQWTLQRLSVATTVLLLGLLLLRSLSGAAGRSWEFFAAACLLSPMVSPIAWTHYQLLLAPMFLILAVRLPRDREALPRWFLLAAAYLLAEISWTPLGTIADLVGAGLFAPPGSRAYGILLTGAAFSQYFLLAVALRWFFEARRTRIVHGPPVLTENAGRGS
jgi:hypothetical protein